MKTKLTIKQKEKKKIELKQQAASWFNHKCSVCKKKKKVMQFHHLEYKDNEKTNKDFKNNLDYQLYILPIVNDRPEDFEYLCRSDHWKITKATKSEETRKQFERLVEVVRATK